MNQEQARKSDEPPQPSMWQPFKHFVPRFRGSIKTWKTRLETADECVLFIVIACQVS